MYDNVEQTHLAEMKYLECCVKESMRLYPPGALMGRRAEQQMEIDGYVVDEGTTVVAVVFHLHRNPLIWDNPNQFIPERFFKGQ